MRNCQDGKGPRTHETAAEGNREEEYKGLEKGDPKRKRKRGSSLQQLSRGGGWHGSFQIPGERGRTGAQGRISRSVSHTRRSKLAVEKGNSSKPTAAAEQEEQANLLPPGG